MFIFFLSVGISIEMIGFSIVYFSKPQIASFTP